MSFAELASLGAVEAARRIADGALSPVALAEACLARIRVLDPRLQAWAHVDEAGALATAREREAEVRAGRGLGPLHGVPIGIKDIFDVAGLPTTGGARPWAHRVPADDAAAVSAVRRKGAVILGKTVTTEFAYRDPAATRNPWNVAHTPGGSSAGSAAAVAARMVPLALGSQTVGSVLRPAAYCGIVGFKGAHGHVPVDGVIPLAWSLDHVGVFARSVADAALVFGVLGALSALEIRRPLRLALAPELLERAEAETAAHVQAAAARFGQAGATIEHVKLPPSFGEIHAAGLVILEVEAAAYHEPDWQRHGGEYGREISAAVARGLTRRAVDYVRADRARWRFRRDVLRTLAPYDALVGPTVPAPAPAGLESTGDGSLCAPWSYTGLPAVTLPGGVSAAGLPHAVQLVGGHDESRLFAVARWCESILAFTAVPAV
jgi:Asp-tRNA(Asn)/Glu-tRNA(Gln) amidotransferase A subunit family amidase